MATEAGQFLIDYLSYWSRNNTVDRESMETFYESSIEFYGRPASLENVMAEKRRFVQRWPVRAYTAFPETVRTTCHRQDNVCRVTGKFSFTASDPRSGRSSRGTGLLTLEIAFDGGRPLIAAETSNVLSRGDRDVQDLEPDF
jgi:hypothetical protein